MDGVWVKVAHQIEAAVYLMEQIIVIINFHILLQIHGIMMDLLGMVVEH